MTLWYRLELCRSYLYLEWLTDMHSTSYICVTDSFMLSHARLNVLTETAMIIQIFSDVRSNKNAA